MARRLIFPCPICDEVFLGQEAFQRHICQNEPEEVGSGWLVLEGRGSTPLFDVARLDEHLVVAMGEAGVALVGQDGTVLERFPEVCFRLVQGQEEVILWAPEKVFRLSRAGLKFWFRRQLDKAARETGAGFWPVVIEHELHLTDLQSDRGASAGRRRSFPLVSGLCLGADRLGWSGGSIGGLHWYEVWEYPGLGLLQKRSFEWKEHSLPVIGSDRMFWLRCGQTGQYHAVDSTMIAPVWLAYDHAPRVEGHYLVVNAKHQLSSQLTVVDLTRPGRQLQILLPDTYYRDLHGEARVQWRIQDECLYIVDSRGRLAAVNLHDGRAQFTHLL